MRTGKGNFAQSELGQILAQSRAAFIAVAVISAVLNVLMLAGSIFMMLVYDSVLPSRSVKIVVTPSSATMSAISACRAGEGSCDGSMPAIATMSSPYSAAR